jgi:hypothetical protein
MTSLASDLRVLFPECLLALAAMGLLMIGVLSGKNSWPVISSSRLLPV